MIGKDLTQRAAAGVLAKDVLRDSLLTRRALEEEREQVLQHDDGSLVDRHVTSAGFWPATRRPQALSSVEPIPTGMSAPCVLAWLASDDPELQRRHQTIHYRAAGHFRSGVGMGSPCGSWVG